MLFLLAILLVLVVTITLSSTKPGEFSDHGIEESFDSGYESYDYY